MQEKRLERGGEKCNSNKLPGLQYHSPWYPSGTTGRVEYWGSFIAIVSCPLKLSSKGVARGTFFSTQVTDLCSPCYLIVKLLGEITESFGMRCIQNANYSFLLSNSTWHPWILAELVNGLMRENKMKLYSDKIGALLVKRKLDLRIEVNPVWDGLAPSKNKFSLGVFLDSQLLLDLQLWQGACCTTTVSM